YRHGPNAPTGIAKAPDDGQIRHRAATRCCTRREDFGLGQQRLERMVRQALPIARYGTEPQPAVSALGLQHHPPRLIAVREVILSTRWRVDRVGGHLPRAPFSA